MALGRAAGLYVRSDNVPLFMAVGLVMGLGVGPAVALALLSRRHDSGIHSFAWRIAAGFVFVALLPLAILFAAAGRTDWWEAWAMAGVFAVATIASRAVLIVKQPDLATERVRWTGGQDVKSWDKSLMPIVALHGPMLMLLAAGLDKRFNGSPPLPLALELAALAVIAAGYAFSAWALAVNRFFSAVVRIQTDRAHTVVTTGPYRFVRHPGYAGGLAGHLVMPLALGTLWAFIPALLTIGALVARTWLEDRVLQAELPGYTAYAQKTRYRLVPGVW